MTLQINRETDALIVVDVQNDFADFRGALYVPSGSAIIPGINLLMSSFDVIVLTQDWHPHNHSSFDFNKGPWPKHCVLGSWGAHFAPALNIFDGSLILRKGTNPLVDSYSAFRENTDKSGKRQETGLAGFLFSRRIRKTYYVGLARDYCVKWSALDANGLDPHFVWDLTRPVDPKSDDAVREELLQNGVKIV